MLKFLSFVFLLHSAVYGISNYDSLDSFLIERTGGGDISIEVKKDFNNKIVGKIKRCNFKELSKENQTKSIFFIKGETAAIASDILQNNDKVTIASKQALLDLASGTWLQLDIVYSNSKKEKMKINSPIVIQGSNVQSVLEDIENQAREENKKICH
ncbi:hypothetical protein [Silvanigrella sp.]|jgi:hypothetical protein|uniref:hypothetical protein n=1 Tax=Silvanigrella sp. TaxID=2024976 RepID=UPI0037C913B3|nr:hypothetical protein [Silvanigrellaceae bacterium]